MNDPAATLDETTAAVQNGPDGSAQREVGMKFSYAGGSKPLDGYTIKRGVGIGGFGEVYFAVSDAGKEVALKRVQRNLDIELRGVSQCLNLKHPNLVDLYDIKYDDQGGAWVVMEFLTGESLKDVVDRNPNGLPLEEVHAWFHGLAAGTAYLHDQGIVHRDLKPGNVFQDQGVVKIGDYGLSKFISCSRRSGHTESVGTFHYMAPEIGKGSYGKEIDIYALGIMLYEMLTGRVPFDGESSQEIIMRHLTEDPDLSKIPPQFRTCVGRALEKDSALRFTSVRAMAEAFPQVGPARVASPQSSDHDVYYIGDAVPPASMVFGPLKQRKVVSTIAAVRAPSPQQPTRNYSAPQTYTPAREPIAAAVGHALKGCSQWCDQTGLGASMKVVIIFAVLLTVATQAPWVLPLGIVLGGCYAIYAVAWTVVTAIRRPSEQPATGIHFRSWQELTRDQLRAKPIASRWGELTGSMLSAAGISALLSIVMIAFADRFDGSLEMVTLFAWLAISSAIGSWTILAVGKWCEGIESDAVRRRIIMLGLGLAFGAAAYALGDLLLLNLHIANLPSQPSQTLYGAGGEARLPLYLLTFGGLFLLPRWWKQTDPMRRTRISLLSVGMCVFLSWIMQSVWPFPQPWGVMLAAMISVAVQLSAPWMSPRERDAAKREFRRV